MFSLFDKNCLFSPKQNIPISTKNVSAEITKTASWADPEDRSTLSFNQIDGAVDRRSFEGHYRVDPSSRLPLNIKGRTGVIGRGLLGKWGPNHAADPIVTTWKRDEVRK